MTILWSARPGARERHLKRKHNNPLFDDFDSVTEEAVTTAREADEQAYNDFIADFEKLVGDIAALEPQAETQEVLDLKARLDQAFEASAILPGDLEPIHDAIQKLMAPMMRAIYKNAQNDPAALATLEEEDNARALHYTLLGNPLVADIFSDRSPIEADELAATLLSEHVALLEQAIEIFTPEQCAVIRDDAVALLDKLKQSGRSTAFAEPQMAIIEKAARQTSSE